MQVNLNALNLHFTRIFNFLMCNNFRGLCWYN